MIPAPPANWPTYGGSAAHTRAYAGGAFNGQLKQSYSRTVAGLMEFPPTYHDGNAFVATDSGNVVSFTASDGVNRWKVSVGGIAADSPTWSNNRVFVQTRGAGATGLNALSATTGALAWRRTGFLGESTATPFGTWICGASSGGQVACFGDYDGSLKWQVKMPCKVTGSLARAGSYLYVADYCGNVRKLGAYHGRTVWNATVPGAVYANLAVSDGRVIVDARDAGAVYAVSVATGTRIWATAVGAGLYASPSVTSTSVYTASRSGRLVKLDVGTGKLRWATQVAGLVMGSPVAVGGRVFFSVMGANFTAGQILGYTQAGMSRSFTFTVDGRYSPCIVAGSQLLLVGRTTLFAEVPV